MYKCRKWAIDMGRQFNREPERDKHPIQGQMYYLDPQIQDYKIQPSNSILHENTSKQVS